VAVGPDQVIEAIVAYYRDIGPNERIDEWISCADPDLFVWHGTIEPARSTRRSGAPSVGRAAVASSSCGSSPTRLP
jgi:hypothetical protein